MKKRQIVPVRSLARDIKFTLALKFLLLFALWFFCFKHIDKQTVDSQQWLMGANKPSSVSTNYKGGGL